MNTLISRAIAPALVALAIGACATTGTGVGSTRSRDVNAVFSWQSAGDNSGTLNASLSNGETFAGKYFQITHESRIEQLGPLWGGWHNSWRGWPYWDARPTDAFVTHYSGRVVANLDGPNQEHMRCRFTLMRPTAGMAGGGQGKCQLPSGKTIDATFARA